MCTVLSLGHLSSFSDIDRVSGPSDSGSRSSSGDTGEGESVRVKCHFRYCDAPYSDKCTQRRHISNFDKDLNVHDLPPSPVYSPTETE